jgi:excinuclease ABC subunit B
VAEEKASYGAGLEAKELIELLERQMREAATALDFETAARLRDQLFEVKARNGGSVARPAVADLRVRR